MHGRPAGDRDDVRRRVLGHAGRPGRRRGDPRSQQTQWLRDRPAAAAQLVLLNAIRRSMGRSLGDLTFYLGGTLGSHQEGHG